MGKKLWIVKIEFWDDQKHGLADDIPTITKRHLWLWDKEIIPTIKRLLKKYDVSQLTMFSINSDFIKSPLFLKTFGAMIRAKTSK